MSDPDFIKRIHSFDQASTGFNTMATFLGAYLESLIGSGFTREEAFILVQGYQKILLAKSFSTLDTDNDSEKSDGQ